MEIGPRGDRRRIGLTIARFDELQLGRVADPRNNRGKRWKLKQLLAATLLGLAAGCRTLRDTEDLTEELPTALRRPLDIPRRTSDSTLRATLVVIDPNELRALIHRQIKAANRRKQLKHDGFPFGVVAIDGKCTSTPFFDGIFAQRHTLKNGDVEVGVQGLVRTLTCSLITSPSKVCLDAIPIPARTNEVGHFAEAFRQLVGTYGKTDLFEMVTLDAGFSSAENAAVIHDTGYGYLMRLKDDRRDLTASAIRRLGHLKANTVRHETVDKVGSSVLVRRMWMERISEVDGWPHVRAIIRVQTTTKSSCGNVTMFDRYYATNYCAAGLNAGHWLALVRQHWAVENNCHWVYDTAFSEDKLPWILEPQGLLNVLLLRRLVFNMLALYRTVTLRGGTPATWLKTLRMFRDSILRANATILATLRLRRPATHTV